MMTTTPTPFEKTPEALEYIQKLQSNRIELDEVAGALEREALSTLLERSQVLRNLTTERSDTEKQIDAAKLRVEQLGRDIDTASGEMAAYAKLLVSAEAARRLPEETEPEETAPEAEAEAEAEPKAETAKGNGAVDPTSAKVEEKVEPEPEPMKATA